MSPTSKFVLVITAFFSKCVAQDLPLKISAVVTDQCSNLLPLNITRYQDLETVNLLLNERYRHPCKCAGNRLAFLNMTDTTQQCPSNWQLISTPVRGCGRSNPNPSCDSAMYASNGFNYNHICGRVIGYQNGTTDAFDTIVNSAKTIDQPYVDGVSLTHGASGSRQHIWTFAAAVQEQGPFYGAEFSCECTNTNYEWPYQVPSFVNNNYFCETGNPGPTNPVILHSDDPLWDGQGCASTSTCCQLNQPPWFCTSLLQTTSDDLELRICSNEESRSEDVIVSLVEIYVALR